MRYFTVMEDTNHKTFTVRATMDLLTRIGIVKGPLSIIQARILNMSYDNFLRYVRDTYDGYLYGKHSPCPYVRFYEKNKAEEFCKLLNIAI